MKKFFEEPSVEVVAFAVEDVITTSVTTSGPTNTGPNDGPIVP